MSRHADGVRMKLREEIPVHAEPAPVRAVSVRETDVRSVKATYVERAGQWIWRDELPDLRTDSRRRASVVDDDAMRRIRAGRRG